MHSSLFIFSHLSLAQWVFTNRVVPKAMSENDSDLEDTNYANENDSDEAMSTDDEKEDYGNEHGDILRFEKRLKFADNLVVDEIERKSDISRMTRNLYKVCSEVIGGQRSKRMVLIIDRRQSEQNEIVNEQNYAMQSQDDDYEAAKDRIYGYLPKHTQNIPTGQYLHESMFNLSRTELVPSESGKIDDDEDVINVLSMDLPNLCVFSVHIHEENVIRAYWHINASASRFFVNDMVNIWPLYFVNKPKSNVPQDTQKIVDLIEENLDSIPLKDSNFDSFFETNTNIRANQAYSKKLV